MKKTIFAVLAAGALLFSSCIPGVNNTTNTSSNSGLLSGILGSVLGNMLGLGFKSSDLQGNWSYNARLTDDLSHTNLGAENDLHFFLSFRHIKL